MTTNLLLARLLIDFGLVVLIWMVQLLIYPSFKYLPSANLFKWHKRYTSNMAIVVMPLMLSQLAIYTIQLFQNQTLFNYFGLTIVILLWVSTFLQFVPLHKDISLNSFSRNTLDVLVSRNWLRTVLWSLLCIVSVIDALQSGLFLL